MTKNNKYYVKWVKLGCEICGEVFYRDKNDVIPRQATGMCDCCIRFKIDEMETKLFGEVIHG
jgi:hypothetical protein